MNQNFIYKTSTSRTFDETLKRVQENAGLEGFRPLYVHDVRATLKEKGFDLEPTSIVEVCNAGLAFEALKLDPQAALAMPCKVVVEERAGEVTLYTLLPEGMVQGEALKALAQKVGFKLISLLDKAASTPSCCSI